ncbi:hypothetical protein ACLB2K_021977 [Fragaria x ananassa]
MILNGPAYVKLKPLKKRCGAHVRSAHEAPFTTVRHQRRRASTPADSSSVPNHFLSSARPPNSSFRRDRLYLKFWVISPENWNSADSLEGKVIGDAAGVRWGRGAPSSALDGGERSSVRTYALKVVSIGGKIAAIRETDIPLLLNNTRLGIALLAAEAMTPVALVPQNFTVTNITEVQLVNTAQNTTANNATEAQPVSLVPQNLTVNNVTEAQLASNQSQSPAVKNVTDAQLLSKRIQNITANNVTKIQLASMQTRNLRPNKFTAAQLVSKQTKNFTAIKVTAAQLVSSKQTKNLTANNDTGVGAESSASLNIAVKNVTVVHW